MPYKQFQNNEALTASDINSYLMNQAVMKFSSRSARTTALPTPTAGMVSIIGNSSMEIYNSTEWKSVLLDGAYTRGTFTIAANTAVQTALTLLPTFSATAATFRVQDASGVDVFAVNPAGETVHSKTARFMKGLSSSQDYLAAMDGSTTVLALNNSGRWVYNSANGNASIGTLNGSTFAGSIKVMVNGTERSIPFF